jgi:hypothetical protein
MSCLYSSPEVISLTLLALAVVSLRLLALRFLALEVMVAHCGTRHAHRIAVQFNSTQILP